MDAIFSVRYENGKVKEITFADDTPLWLKNLMRGFASSFQIDMENIESGERAWYSEEVGNILSHKYFHLFLTEHSPWRL